MTAQRAKFALATLCSAVAAALTLSLANAEESTPTSEEVPVHPAALEWPSLQGYTKVNTYFASMNDRPVDVYEEQCYGLGKNRHCERVPMGVKGIAPDRNDDNGFETHIETWRNRRGDQISLYCRDRDSFPEESRPERSPTYCSSTRWAALVMPLADPIDGSYWLIDETCSGNPTTRRPFSSRMPGFRDVYLPDCIDILVNPEITETTE